MEVGGGEGGDLFERNSAQFGQRGCGVSDQRRLVLLTAVRDGGEKWCVRLDQNAVGGRKGCNLAQAGGPGVGQVAGEREIKAEVERAPRLLDRAGKAVQDARRNFAAILWVPVRVQQLQQILPCVGCAELLPGLWRGQLRGAAMDEDRLAGCGGDLHLRDEGSFLHLGHGVVDVVEVEADLADGDASDALAEGGQQGKGFGGGLAGFLGVDAGAGVDLWEVGGVGGLSDVERVVHEGRAVANADGEDGADTGCVSACEDARELVCGDHVEVGVGVDEVHRGQVQGTRFEGTEDRSRAGCI